MKNKVKAGAAKRSARKRGLHSPLAQLVIGASAAIAGGILAGLWAIGRPKRKG